MDLKLFIETFGKAGQKVFIIFNYVVLILIIQHFVLIAIIKHLCELFPGKQVDCNFKGTRGWCIKFATGLNTKIDIVQKV